MAKKIFPMYMEEDMHIRYKKLYNAKYKHMSFYAMFIELSLPAVEKFEREESKK